MSAEGTADDVKVALTGASGFVGSQLVPRLAARGYHLLLVGRECSTLNSQFPGMDCCNYDELGSLVAGYDLLIHAAVANNNVTLPEKEVFETNVCLTVDVVQKASHAGVKNVIFLSSVFALNQNDNSAYARSKRKAAAVLKQRQDIPVITLFLPLVYGDRWPRRLSWLGYLPRPVASALFLPLSYMSPTVHIDRVANFICEFIEHKGRDYEDTIIRD